MKRALSLCLPLAAIMLIALSGCGGGGYSPTVYTAGFYHDGAKYIPCYWEGATRHDLPGDSVHDAQAYGICLAGGVVYTAGYYIGPREDGGTKTIPCYWEGTTRHDLEEGPAPYSGTARAIFVDGGGTVYTAGHYRDGNQTKPCYWTGTERHDLSGSSEGRAYSIFVDGGTVYTAGSYYDGAKTNACYWRGTARHDLPGDGTHRSCAESIFVQ